MKKQETSVLVKNPTVPMLSVPPLTEGDKAERQFITLLLEDANRPPFLISTGPHPHS